ncbi:MAG: hypothetical protein V1743_00770 [Nanoarchaeota archaeon]
MRLQKHLIILGMIFLATFLLRIILAFQTPYLEYDGYFNLRQVEHIQKTGIPLYKDDLSYGGRVNIFPPVFQYVLALFSQFSSPEFAVKVIPNLFASTIVIFVYLVCNSLTGKKSVSLLSAFFSGFVPAFFSSTIAAVSVYSFVVPLFFFIVYLMLNFRKQHILYVLFIALLVLVFSHPIIFVLILALIIHLLLLKVEGFEIRKQYLELLLFLTFFSIWISFFIYNKAFLFHGISIIWQNIPGMLLQNYFIDINYLQIIYLVGFIPLVFGLISVHHILFQYKRTNFLFIISISITFFILLLLKMVQLDIGLAFLSILLIILSAHALDELILYVQKTKFSTFIIPAFVVIIIVFLFTSFFQAIVLASEQVKKSPSAEDVKALVWLKENSHVGQTVLGSIDEGYLITYYAQRKNVADNNFLLVKNINTRYDEVTKVFDLKLETEAVRILNKYEVDYIYFSEESISSRKSLPGYLSDFSCFTLIYNQTVKIFNVHCRLT